MKKNLLLIVCIFFSCIQNAFPQTTCNGSLGEPIVNITFGQGPNPGAVLSSVVPGASTSYTYVAPTGSPASNIVLDGDYAIVNSVPANPYWLQTGDHTNNGNGYMAFFNAAPNPGEFYKQTVSGLCPGTTYEFAAWIMNALNSDKAAGTVPPNVTFKIFNPSDLTTPLTVFSTGDILPTNVVVWKQFATLFTTPAGINSVVLTLTNNNIGGANSFGNDLAIDDITFRACGPLTQASFSSAMPISTLTICGNLPYTLYGTVSAGLNTPAYQWQISSNNGTNWNDISGATSLNYTSNGLAAGTYQFRLVSQEAANISSLYCKFYSNIIVLTVSPFNVTAEKDTAYCSNTSISRVLHATGGNSYAWSPAIYLDNSSSPDPVATISNTTKFYVLVSNGLGCSSRDSVTLTINALPTLITSGNSNICKDSVLKLNVSGANTYTWVPPALVSNPSIPNPVFTGTQSAALTVTGTTALGCRSNATINITVKPLPVIQTIKDTSICINQVLVLATTGGNTYSWSPATGLSDPNIASPQFVGTVGKKYIVTGSASGCSAKDSVTVTVNPLPTLTTSGNSNICKDSILVLNVSGANTYSWSPVALVSNPAIANPIFTGTQSALLTITGTSVFGCKNNAALNITVNPIPFVKTINDTTLCTPQPITLTTTGANTYSWSPANGLNNPSISSPVYSGTTTQKYIVTGTTNGCSSKDSVTVTPRLKQFLKQPPAKSFCNGESVVLDGFNGDDVSYLWTGIKISNPSIKTPTVTPGISTTYDVTVSDAVCNYDTLFNVSVTALALPNIRVQKSNDVNCTNATAQLTATGGNTYSWAPSATLNKSTGFNPVATPSITTQYFVTGTDLNGCKNKDSITVEKNNSNGIIYVPNSFTPNNDTKNDCFHVLVSGVIQNFHMTIFNRYGEKVFETHNSKDCWDGNYKGAIAPIGNYVYYLNGETSCGKIFKEGNLLLIR